MATTPEQHRAYNRSAKGRARKARYYATLKGAGMRTRFNIKRREAIRAQGNSDTVR